MTYLQFCCCWLVPPYVSMFSWDVCHQKLLEMVHREEVKVNWILSAKVEFLNSEKRTKSSIQTPAYNGNSQLSKRTPKNGARTERAWYLIWKAADRCFLRLGTRNASVGFRRRCGLQVIRHIHFVASRFETHLKSISFQKNNLEG